MGWANHLPALRTLCWESARVELLTPRTMMESIQLTRVGPGEILQHRDGISINSHFVRAVSALGMLQDAREGISRADDLFV